MVLIVIIIDTMFLFRRYGNDGEASWGYMGSAAHCLQKLFYISFHFNKVIKLLKTTVTCVGLSKYDNIIQNPNTFPINSVSKLQKNCGTLITTKRCDACVYYEVMPF